MVRPDDHTVAASGNLEPRNGEYPAAAGSDCTRGDHRIIADALVLPIVLRSRLDQKVLHPARGYIYCLSWPTAARQ